MIEFTYIGGGDEKGTKVRCSLCENRGWVKRFVDWDSSDYDDWYLARVDCPECQVAEALDEEDGQMELTSVKPCPDCERVLTRPTPPWFCTECSPDKWGSEAVWACKDCDDGPPFARGWCQECYDEL